MKTLAFKTGRDYTEHGQRIAATKLESGHIVMLDIDRRRLTSISATSCGRMTTT
jgi:hypothetical protein